MTLDIILFRKKNQIYYILLVFSLFLSTCYLVSLINDQIIRYWCEEGNPIIFEGQNMA